MQRWLVAMVYDGGELALAASLHADHGIEAYAPAHRRWRKLAKHVARKEGRTRELVTDALLQGYLFVKLDMSDNFDLSRLLKVKGVFGVISTIHGPCFARDADIEAMREIERSGVHDAKLRAVHVRKPVAQISEQVRERLSALSLTDIVGKVVRLAEGPFKGMRGEVTEVRKGQAKIMVSAVSVQAPLEMISID